MIKLLLLIILQFSINSTIIKLDGRITIKNEVENRLFGIDRIIESNNTLYVLDKKMPMLGFVTKKDSTIKSLLKKGRGPRELNLPGNMTYSHEMNNILINTDTNRLDIYSINTGDVKTIFVNTPILSIRRIIHFDNKIIVSGGIMGPENNQFYSINEATGNVLAHGSQTEGYTGLLSFKSGGTDVAVFKKYLYSVELNTYKIDIYNSNLKSIKTFNGNESKIYHMTPKIKENRYSELDEVMNGKTIIRYIYSTSDYLIVELMKFKDFSEVYIDVFDSSSKKVIESAVLDGFILGVNYYDNSIITKNIEDQQLDYFVLNKYSIICNN